MRVVVDLEGLRAALTCRGEEWTHYLDLRTGDIRRSRFAGFREEGDESSEEEIEIGLAEGILRPIESLGARVEHGWMKRFTASLSDAPLRGRLDAALRGRRPLRRFQEALVNEHVTRTLWLAFRGERASEAVREWLAVRRVELVPQGGVRSRT